MSQAQPLINKLVVVGLGLIGGSLAAGLKRRGGCVETIGVVRTAEAGAQALKRGVVDRTCASLAEVAPELGPGDVVFISVPTLAVAGVLEQIRDCLDPQVTVTGGASVKGSVAKAAVQVYGLVQTQLNLGYPIESIWCCGDATAM